MSSVEFVSDPIAVAVEEGHGCPFDPETMVQIEDAYIQGLRRETGYQDLLLYKDVSKEDGLWMLAKWLYPPGRGHPHGIMVEFESYQEDPRKSNQNRASYAYLKDRILRTREHVTMVIKNLERKARKKKDEQVAQFEKRKDWIGYLKRAGREKMAKAVEWGDLPFTDRVIEREKV